MANEESERSVNKGQPIVIKHLIFTTINLSCISIFACGVRCKANASTECLGISCAVLLRCQSNGGIFLVLCEHFLHFIAFQFRLCERMFGVVVGRKHIRYWDERTTQHTDSSSVRSKPFSHGISTLLHSVIVPVHPLALSSLPLFLSLASSAATLSDEATTQNWLHAQHPVNLTESD